MKPTIVLLEDEPDIANLVTHHLEHAGFAVHTRSAGDKVVSWARANPPALFILDVMVPGVSGFDVCRQVRDDRTLAKVPIIFLTAKAGEVDRVRGLELGADDYISKPFSPRELVARVRAVLRRFEQPVSANITTPDFSLDC
ncbi:MAG TPA: response regulator, partial [Candidatus Angelobacter sp.]|nr:response regulator [Candidatus Angelobacter sp.]